MFFSETRCKVIARVAVSISKRAQTRTTYVIDGELQLDCRAFKEDTCYLR